MNDEESKERIRKHLARCCDKWTEARDLSRALGSGAVPVYPGLSFKCDLYRDDFQSEIDLATALMRPVGMIAEAAVLEYELGQLPEKPEFGLRGQTVCLYTCGLITEALKIRAAMQADRLEEMRKRIFPDEAAPPAPGPKAGGGAAGGEHANQWQANQNKWNEVLRTVLLDLAKKKPNWKKVDVLKAMENAGSRIDPKTLDKLPLWQTIWPDRRKGAKVYANSKQADFVAGVNRKKPQDG